VNSTDVSRVELVFIIFDFSSVFGRYSVLKNKNKYIINDIIILYYIKIRTATVFYSVSTLWIILEYIFFSTVSESKLYGRKVVCIFYSNRKFEKHLISS
jgi:hypothetical protein